MKPITLRDAESRTLELTGECVIERPVKPQPLQTQVDMRMDWWEWKPDEYGISCYSREALSNAMLDMSPLGQPGERRWCQETWCNPDYLEDGITCRDYTYYKATHDDPKEWRGCWRSPVTMPRWASRFTVEVLSTDVFIRDGVWCWRARVRRVEDA